MLVLTSNCAVRSLLISSVCAFCHMAIVESTAASCFLKSSAFVFWSRSRAFCQEVRPEARFVTAEAMPRSRSVTFLLKDSLT